MSTTAATVHSRWAIWDDAKLDRLAYGVVVAFTLFVLLFGWQFHPIEEVRGPEKDGYVAKAEELRQGKIPVDHFRPLFYPLAAAGVGAVLDDTFAGARLVSQLSAGLLALLTYLLGSRCFSRQVGILALLGIVTNYTVIVAGMHAATDMLFSAFVTLMLLLLCRKDANRSYGSIVVLGLVFALAYFTRYTAMALIPSVIVAFLIGGSLRARVTYYRLALFAAAAAVFLLPHFVLTAEVFGNPFYNENWKSLGFKLYGDGDWGYYARIPYDGLMAIIVAAPLTVVASAMEELFGFFVEKVPDVTGNSNMTLIGFLFLGCFLLGVWRSLFALDRNRIILLLFGVVYMGLVSFFYAWRARLVLPILPLIFIFVGYFISSVLLPRIRMAAPVRGRWVVVAALGMLLVLQGAPLALNLYRFVERHPLAEVAAAQQLETQYGSEVRVLSTFAHLWRQVNFATFYLSDAVGAEVRDKERYYDRIISITRTTKPDYLLIGRVTLGNRPKDLLLGKDVPPFLELLAKDADVAVYRVVLDAGADGRGGITRVAAAGEQERDGRQSE